MAKLKNVTMEELRRAEDAAFEIGQIAADLDRRARQGYSDEIKDPLAFARSFAAASRSLAELSAWLLGKAALNEQRRETEAMLKNREQ